MDTSPKLLFRAQHHPGARSHWKTLMQKMSTVGGFFFFFVVLSSHYRCCFWIPSQKSQSSQIPLSLPHKKVKQHPHCPLRFLSFLFQNLSLGLIPRSVGGAAYVSFVRILLHDNKRPETKN